MTLKGNNRSTCVECYARWKSSRSRASAAAAACLLLGGIPLRAAEFYVSPDGDDANPGTAARPIRTVGHASRILKAGDSCIISGGIYRETVVPPSGSATEPVIYRARPGEQVIISGCELVNGWRTHSGAVYRAPWKGTLGAGNQTFVNGAMVFQARWPDNPSGSLTALPLGTADQDSSKTTIRCAQLPSVDLTGAQVWIMSGTRWEAWTSDIESTAPGSITFADHGYDSIACRPGASFYLFGSLALLSENEWVADEKFLYLQTPVGVNPGSLKVEAKARYYGLDLSHRQHVQFHGIQLFGCSIKTDSATENILIDGMRARYLGHWETPGTGLARGIFLSTGTHNMLLHHNVVWHCWEGGFHGEPPMEYVQLINNTFYTTLGSFDSGGIDISSFTYVDDQVGCFVLNNVFTDEIRTLGHDVTIAGNLLKGTDPQFVAPEKFDFRLKPTSPARVLGRSIAGISPKVGAGAYAGGDWKPGHDFNNPPKVDLTFSESPFRNRLLNSGFESGLDSWEPNGPAGGVSRQPLNADPTTNKDGPVHSGRSAIRLAGSGSGLRQATSVLSPDSTYILTGWAKLTAANAQAKMGVSGSFGAKAFCFANPGGPSSWLRGSVAFTTGPRAESVSVIFENSGEAGAADVLVDDIGLFQSLSQEPLLTTARADIELNLGNGLNQFDLSGHWQRTETWTKDDQAQVRFEGRQAVIYARVFESGGIAAVSIDDGPETLVDFYYPQLPHHATVQPIIPVFRSELLPLGPHTLKLRVTGNKNPASPGKTIRPAYLNILE